MDEKDVKSLIEKKLEQSEKSIRNKNSIEALCSLFPSSSALWKVLSGSKEAIETEKSRITQETILDILIAIDNKLETGSTDSQKFKVLLDGVVSFGDVSGLKAKASNPIVSELFSEKEIEIILKNIHAHGNVTGVDLTVDQELELKKKMQIKTPHSSVTFNAGPNCKVVFGKGSKQKK